MRTIKERLWWRAARIVDIVMEEQRRRGDGEDARLVAIARINAVFEQWFDAEHDGEGV